ncbi:MAG: amino acid ABC transporter permease [Oscillospiraceae bacterium]|nr:amino acid ABC transporter permease [Oscillospiraceae bacterium]
MDKISELLNSVYTWFCSTDLAKQFSLNFIKDNRYLYITKGLGITLTITLFSALLGLLLGIVAASVRSTYDLNKDMMSRKKNIGYYVFSAANQICKLYITIIRGTPMVVQLMIMYYVIFASSTDSTRIAIIAFGINSGAYVAEIIRAGIMSIDRGQFEAGRSLGLNYIQTMLYIIMPQVIKSVLPSLLNEIIALLKETSVAGYVGIKDLTKGAEIIKGVTYSAFMPLLMVAFIYLVIVIILTKIVSRIERRLRRNER